MCLRACYAPRWHAMGLAGMLARGTGYLLDLYDNNEAISMRWGTRGWWYKYASPPCYASCGHAMCLAGMLWASLACYGPRCHVMSLTGMHAMRLVCMPCSSRACYAPRWYAIRLAGMLCASLACYDPRWHAGTWHWLLAIDLNDNNEAISMRWGTWRWGYKLIEECYEEWGMLCASRACYAPRWHVMSLAGMLARGTGYLLELSKMKELSW